MLKIADSKPAAPQYEVALEERNGEIAVVLKKDGHKVPDGYLASVAERKGKVVLRRFDNPNTDFVETIRTARGTRVINARIEKGKAHTARY